MKLSLKPTSAFMALACLGIPTNAQVLVSDNEPKQAVYLEISPLEKFQQELDLYGPQIGLISSNSPKGNPRINKRITDTRTGLTFIVRSGELALKRIEDSSNGDLRYLATLQDAWNGRARTISQSDIDLMDRNSQDVEFTLTPFSAESLPVSVVVMIDRSDSMNGFMPEVVEAANALFDMLPNQIRCEALIFETTHYWHGNFNDECSRDGVSLSTIQARGGTYLYTAMTDAYEHLNGREDDVLQTLIVLTDGRPLDPEQKAQALAAKGDVQTIFMWLGNSSSSAEADFAPFADAYVEDPDGAWRHLEDYFSVYADAFNKQSIITVRGR